MKHVDTSNVQAAGSFEGLPAGGYICKYVKVEDMPNKEYLYMEYDIAEGTYANYYTELQARLKADWWGGRVIRSYKPKALPMFKRMCNAVSQSNGNYVFDGNTINADEKTLVGKKVGLILQEEEYMSNSGDVRTRLIVAREVPIDVIKQGKFKIPPVKKLKEEADDSTPFATAKPSADSFMNIPDADGEESPFN